MSADAPNPFDREAQAQVELGITAIAPWSRRILLGAFLATVTAWPAIEFLRGDVFWRGMRAGSSVATKSSEPGLSPIARLLAANRALIGEFQALEDDLGTDSVISHALLPVVQGGLARWLGAGNEQTYLGRDGWLFFRDDIDYVTGRGFLDPAQLRARAASGDSTTPAPQPDPVEAIVDFAEALAARNIQLIIVPTPVKPSVQADKFSRRGANASGPIDNPSKADFARAIQNRLQPQARTNSGMASVILFDPADLLFEARQLGDPYLKTDTHWQPWAMERIAAALARHLEDHITLSPPSLELRRAARTITGLGDTAAMLRLAPGQTLFPPETVEILEVLDARDQPWRADASAEVLVLGDSFSNIYSLDALGWGASAGWVEQLSYHLRRPVDAILRNDAGSLATRQLLARELARGHDRLAGKRLVVWQFAARELAFGDWKRIELKLGTGSTSRFLSPVYTGAIEVEGEIADLARTPRPGSVPYRDHVIAVHLRELRSASRDVNNAEVLVYFLSMRDNVWQAPARWRPGDRVQVRLVPWSEVESLQGALNRAELDAEALLLEDPYWGEPLQP